MPATDVVNLYEKIVKQAKKDKYALPCLDDILAEERVTSAAEVNIGVMNIPLDQVVGTKTTAISLYIAHEEEGIRDAVKAYEYKQRFYVEEGNKRVSVLKAFGADEIVADVIRIMPPRSEENQIYYEFVDFFRLSQVYDFKFSELGS